MADRIEDEDERLPSNVRIRRSATDNIGMHRSATALHSPVAKAVTENSVLRSLPAAYVPGEPSLVRIAARPIAAASVYAVEERAPSGWQAVQISDGGVFDSVNQMVKWGPFFDNLSRDLSYVVSAPTSATGTVNFAGAGSFDGVGSTTAGSDLLVPGSRVFLQRPSLQGPFEVRLLGEVGAVYRIEVSSDLANWNPVTILTNATGQMILIDPLPLSTPRFYRARPQP